MASRRDFYSDDEFEQAQQMELEEYKQEQERNEMLNEMMLEESEFLKCYTPCGDNGLCNRCDRLIDAISELAELKTKLENGTLVELPCKVGDKVKVLCDSWGNVWNYKTIDYGKFLVGEIISITITKKQVLMKIQAEHNVEWKRERRRYPISALGKTVFLTSEEAEKALKEGEK